MVQKMLGVEKKLQTKIGDLETVPEDLKAQLAAKESELSNLKQTANKRQGMVQQMLTVETKLKAQITLLEIKARNAAKNDTTKASETTDQPKAQTMAPAAK